MFDINQNNRILEKAAITFCKLKFLYFSTETS